MQVVHLLRELGYQNVRHYSGGISDWLEHGGSQEASGRVRARAPASGNGSPRTATPAVRSHGRILDFVDRMASRTVGDLFAIWLAMVVGFGLLYWILGSLGAGLLAGNHPIRLDLEGFLDALYFSGVTATSLGYGDVLPVGIIRLFAVIEAVAELLIFGIVISKFVGRRQEQLMEEVHRNAFEARLGRVRLNLHLCLLELQSIAEKCTGGTDPPARVLARAESTAAVFAGELQSVHDLLYRPFENPEEPVLENILASLASGMQELNDLASCLPTLQRATPAMHASYLTIARLAGEICGECVPRAYAADLKGQMDRIQELGRRLLAA